MLTTSLVLLIAAAGDAPRAIVLTPDTGALALRATPAEVPEPLKAARRLADQLRYEEAVVEYQRYLALPARPPKERGEALMDLGFIHLVLGDKANAEARALEALELEPSLQAPPGAPAKQVQFVDDMRRLHLARARVELQPREGSDAPNVVRVVVADPEKRVTQVLLRHALSPDGPYYATEMRCDGDTCVAAIPPPVDAPTFTAYYFVEALDATAATQAKVGSPDSPLQLSVADQRPWYTSPVVWGIAGAVLVGVGAAVYALSPQPPQ